MKKLLICLLVSAGFLSANQQIGTLVKIQNKTNREQDIRIVNEQADRDLLISVDPNSEDELNEKLYKGDVIHYKDAQMRGKGNVTVLICSSSNLI